MISIKTLLPILLIGFMLVAVTVLKAKAKREKDQRHAAIQKKPPLTKNEQPMYFRLVAAFPEHLILAQVAFSALLTAQGRATRNRFDRKVADFVLCSKAFEVIAVIELDDSSHNGREKEDEEREKLLTNAGYRVIRYRKVPDLEKLKNDVIAMNNEPGAEKTEQKRVKLTQ